MPPRGRRLLALAVSTTLGVVSCSDGPGAGTPSTPTTAPTTTPAQELGPELPDDAAVRAALSDYYAAVNRAVTGRSVSALDAVTTPDCTCRDRYVRVIERLNEQDVTTSGFFVTGVATGEVTLEGDRATVTSIETTEAYDIVDAAGAVVDRVAPAQTVVFSTFAAAEGDWLVSGVEDG